MWQSMFFGQNRMDICTMGKIIGGGFPLAALGGRADIMAQFDRATVGEDRFLTQIGTLSGNPVASVAGLATMEVLREPGAYGQIFATGRSLLAQGVAGRGNAVGLGCAFWTR
jgi:glutamate-1-semialdehyde 2,1-aminomutase